MRVGTARHDPSTPPVSALTPPTPPTDSGKGLIGRSYEEGATVIWSFIDELPDASLRQAMPWLTVVAWPYDGSNDDGMPSKALQATMFDVERALYPLEESPFSWSAYRRTGNGLKEFVFYVGDREAFMQQFNALLAGLPRHPLEIKFHEDPSWSDLAALIADFKPQPAA